MIKVVFPLLLCGSSGVSMVFSFLTPVPSGGADEEARSLLSAFSKSTGISDGGTAVGGVLSAPMPASATASACAACDGISTVAVMVESFGAVEVSNLLIKLSRRLYDRFRSGSM